MRLFISHLLWQRGPDQPANQQVKARKGGVRVGKPMFRRCRLVSHLQYFFAGEK